VVGLRTARFAKLHGHDGDLHVGRDDRNSGCGGGRGTLAVLALVPLTESTTPRPTFAGADSSLSPAGSPRRVAASL
jgi:hypothetical protein